MTRYAAPVASWVRFAIVDVVETPLKLILSGIIRFSRFPIFLEQGLGERGQLEISCLDHMIWYEEIVFFESSV